MLREDFELYNIKYFTPEEIRRTGARLEDVDAETIIHLDRMRKRLNTPIYIIENGLTSGEHSSQYHKKGLAVDTYTDINSFLFVNNWIRCALDMGFRGIGCYYNDETGIYTYHTDLRPCTAFWAGWKLHTADNWTYSGLFRNPAYIY